MRPAATDPVRLHRLHAFGPARQASSAAQQFGRVVCDTQEPLRQPFLLDQRAGAPAPSVDHLLVREHRAIDRVPVHPAFLSLGQAGAQQVEEQPLLLAVIIRVARRELARPVERQSHPLQLAPHGGDVLARSRQRDARHARGPHSPPEGRTHPIPSDAAPNNRAPACNARPRRRAYSCERAPYGSFRWGMGTFREHSIWAVRPRARLRRGSSRAPPTPVANAARLGGSRSAVPRPPERAP